MEVTLAQVKNLLNRHEIMLNNDIKITLDYEDDENCPPWKLFPERHGVASDLICPVIERTDPVIYSVMDGTKCRYYDIEKTRQIAIENNWAGVPPTDENYEQELSKAILKNYSLMCRWARSEFYYKKYYIFVYCFNKKVYCHETKFISTEEDIKKILFNLMPDVLAGVKKRIPIMIDSLKRSIDQFIELEKII